MKSAEFAEPVDGIWDDGEWISWEWINSHLDDDGDFDELDEMSEAAAPLTTLELTDLFLELVALAAEYKERTGRYLQIWGELGEIYAEIRHGLKRHPRHFAGSDGTIGDDLVEVKTISPEKTNNRVLVKRAGNFSKLLIVRITDDFRFASMLISRSDLNEGDGRLMKAKWSSDASL